MEILAAAAMPSHRAISGEMPLLQFGDETRARTAERRKRRHLVAAVVSSGVVIALSALCPPRPLLIWNMTASAPIGLYILSPARTARVDDWVAARTPNRFEDLAVARRYIPRGMPLIKHVAATAGETVCAVASRISIDGRLVAVRRPLDGGGRVLPSWTGCRRLRPDEIFLLNNNPDSFDARYFGPSRQVDVIGQVTLIWG